MPANRTKREENAGSEEKQNRKKEEIFVIRPKLRGKYMWEH
jgi:hypothetical protein